MKKANAILEYGILLTIVIGMLASMHYFLKRHVQARIKHEVDTKLRRPIPFLWQSQVTFSKQKSTYKKEESIGGDVEVDSTTSAAFTTLSAPPPPGGIPVGSLHSQDPALPAPGQQNPQHQRQTDGQSPVAQD